MCETPPRVAQLCLELKTFGDLIVSLETTLSENEWYNDNCVSDRSLVDDLEIFTISDELLEEILENIPAPIAQIKVEEIKIKDFDQNYQKPRKRKLTEDLEAKSIESPAKRRAPVQNICDNNKAPEVQNKVKTVQNGQDSPKDSPQDSSQDPPTTQMNMN